MSLRLLGTLAGIDFQETENSKEGRRVDIRDSKCDREMYFAIRILAIPVNNCLIPDINFLGRIHLVEFITDIFVTIELSTVLDVNCEV
jgi:hypothetical protein